MNYQTKMHINKQKVGQFTIDLNQTIGNGSYAIVYLCSHPQIKEQLCVKIVKINQEDLRLYREFEIMKMLKYENNPNLTRIFDVQSEDNKLYIFMEYCKGGDLKNQMKRRLSSPFSTTEVLNILTQIINGYKTLFERQIFHRDLKPANVLFDNGSIKIIDFGSARYINDMNVRYQNTSRGTEAYASPQIMFGEPYSSKSDIYSLGVILYQLVKQRLPFEGSDRQDVIKFQKQLRKEPFKCEEIEIVGCPEDKAMIRKLIDQMLTFKEEDRISWEELFQNKYVQQNNKQNIFDQIQEDVSIIVDTIIIETEQDQNQKIDQSEEYKIIYDLNKNNTVTKINHLIQLLLAKSHLANQLVWAMVELKQSQLNFLNDLNYILIQTCLIGYRYRIAQNAYGFSQNILDLICDEIRRVYDVYELQRDLQEYSIDQSEYSQQVRYQAHIERDESNSQFLIIEKSLIENKTKYNYPTDINNFYRLINIQNNTDYKIYGKWFFYFYKKELKDRFNFYEQQTQPNSILKVLALTQMFLKIDEEFPFEKYLELDPRQVCLPDEPDKPYLIKILNKYRQL